MTIDLPAHEGLCQMCVDRHNCPMVEALYEQDQLPGQQYECQQVHMVGHAVTWCPMYG